jgi:hypothetical protein
MADEERASSTAVATVSDRSVHDVQGGLDDSGGYHHLAELLRQYPEIGIYRSFNQLNSLNLLYYEAELIDLEKDLLLYSHADSKSDDPARRQYSRSWWQMRKRERKEDDDSSSNKQWRTMLKIREVLKEYSESKQYFLNVFHR